MKRYPKYKDAAELYKVCMLYAQSYSITMVQRVLDEEPTYFEDKEINKDEFQAHLQNNICLGISKYRSSVFKDTTAQFYDDSFTTDKVRRLVNGGDRFHPYL